MLNAAVIGTGYIARKHLDCLRNLPTANAVAVCDLSPSIAEAAAEEFRIPRWYTDPHHILESEQPDVVHITTPPRSHIPLALDALVAGAHVLVEKPITFDSADLRRLLNEARSRALTVVENRNYLFNRSVQ